MLGVKVLHKTDVQRDGQNKWDKSHNTRKKDKQTDKQTLRWRHIGFYCVIKCRQYRGHTEPHSLKRELSDYSVSSKAGSFTCVMLCAVIRFLRPAP